MQPERLIDPNARHEDEALDRAIRPQRLADYVGQPVVREQTKIGVNSGVGMPMKW